MGSERVKSENSYVFMDQGKLNGGLNNTTRDRLGNRNGTENGRHKETLAKLENGKIP